MRSSYLAQPLAWLLMVKLAVAGDIIDSLSFGHHGGINRDMPGWRPTAYHHEIQYYSDRIILTPPYPGGTRGAFWSEAKSTTTDWTAEFQFRVSGQESGGGNLQLWYTKEREIIGTNSALTVGNFDGLVLVIDQYNHGGSIRGFLNDGEHNFSREPQLESLAFGHCQYNYRNLGRPSKLRVSNHNGLTVTIDDQICFSTPEVQMPPGYYFGVSATTPDVPDSFEIFKLEVTTGGDAPPPAAEHHQQQNHLADSHIADHFASHEPHHEAEHHSIDFAGSPEVLPDVDADTITKQDDQFADLHNRLQGMTHLISNIYVQMGALRENTKEHHETQKEHLKTQNERLQNIQGSKETGLPSETVNTINRLSERLDNIERLLQAAQREQDNSRSAMSRLQTAVDQMHGGISEHLPEKIGHRKFFPSPS
jgi:mannose-binding lectin 1